MSEKKKADQPKQITFEYKISPAYFVYGVSGVHGGLNGQGQIIMNFFNERHAIPKTQTYSIQENGSISKLPIAEEKKGHIIRDVMLAISISPSTARAFAAWLNDKADQFDKLFPKESKEDTDVQREKAH